ncbi:hypothetical protein [Halomonas rhizosphaerae]|uniref:Uncharacterized protein n=1 Tax=Halomonas rhizosphaerae TaxID=3043296 RepID=A0ABT6UXG6_9GAMM|nr:hypothetical protein [Halomonas rhizosphaerae]MDI5890649.1 hypothetical protein [Halomonas rhizosphaerae]
MKRNQYDTPITKNQSKRSMRDPNSVAGRCRAKGVNPGMVYPRLKRMSLEEALNTPSMSQKESASLAGKASRAAARARRDQRGQEQGGAS